MAETGRGEDKDGYKAEFIRLINSYNFGLTKYNYKNTPKVPSRGQFT